MEKETLEEKKQLYSSDLKNFRADREIMVEITLDEYRELVSSLATYKERVRHLEDKIEKLSK